MSLRTRRITKSDRLTHKQFGWYAWVGEFS